MKTNLMVYPMLLNRKIENVFGRVIVNMINAQATAANESFMSANISFP
jgi:hypothetical protein